MVARFQPEAEVFQKHHVPRAVGLGQNEGQEIRLQAEGDTLAPQLFTASAIDATGAEVFERGDVLALRLGNPRLQGPWRSCFDREGAALSDDAGMPVLVRHVHQWEHDRDRYYARYADPRLHSKC